MGWRKKKDEVPRRRKLSDDAVADRASQDLGRSLFRRNRTLVGSRSPQVSSASELSGSLVSPRAQAHHLNRHRRRLGSMFMMTLIGAGFLVWFLYEFSAGIVINSSVDSSTVQTDRYQKLITDYLAGRPLERLRTITNRDQLTKYLQQFAPEVETVASLRSGGFATTRYDIVFRQPVASWLIGADVYYVDKHGVSFQLNYFKQPTVKIIDDSGVPQVAGTAVASSKFLRFVGLAVETAREYGVMVKQATIPANTTRQIELLIAKHAYPIKLSLDRPVGEQIEDMKRAVAYLDKKKIKPSYVDVRISGKAYYK